jgi:hypothetical protein
LQTRRRLDILGAATLKAKRIISLQKLNTSLSARNIFLEELDCLMKKFLVVFLALLVFTVTLPLAADAQSCRRKVRKSSASRTYRTQPRYAVQGYQAQRRPSFYRRHRNLINIGIATGAGALVGGLVGGRRGAGWGMLAGAGSGALYTYKMNPKRRRY